MFSGGSVALTAAFADVVSVRAGFPPHELPKIFSVPLDDGENDAARDLVRLDAEHMTRMFALGRIAAFSWPIGGGEVVGIASFRASLMGIGRLRKGRWRRRRDSNPRYPLPGMAP